jgi:hypothetical protein
MLGEENSQEDEDKGKARGGKSDPVEEQRVVFFVLAIIPGGRARGLRIVFGHMRTFFARRSCFNYSFCNDFRLTQEGKRSPSEIFVRSGVTFIDK